MKIFYGRQQITQDDISAVVETLQSDYLTQGPKVEEFEFNFSEYVGCKYAVAVSSGTAALHLCVLSLGIESGDKVITTPITFAASANCVQYCGGEIVFADIDPSTYLIDINHVKKLLESSPKGTYKGIIAVDFAGRAVDLEAFRKLADDYGCWIIEDSCHSPGGFFVDSNGKQQNCGNGNFADLAIFSFHPVKHVACGEGGMITTNNLEHYNRLLMLRTHGITRNSNLFQNSIAFANGTSALDAKNTNTDTRFSNIEKQILENKYPGWYMEMQMLGYNYRLTDFQAALGISQLKRAEAGIASRREIALKYDEAFADFSNITCLQKNTNNFNPIINNGHAYHLYIIEVNDRLGLYNYLRENQIFAQIHYYPVHLMPYYRNLGWKENDLPFVETYYQKCISLPMYPTLTNEEQEYI
jgi:UDP-4-amino-4,6-dideoxy-N-acetyl-beta-L-altrosamine transaminase